MRPHFIYALYDPREPESIRYIGYSHDPVGRLYSHLWEARNTDTHTRKLSWIRSLLAQEIEPGCRTLCSVDSKEQAAQREIEVIAAQHAAGSPLTNGTGGGDGAIAWTQELRDRRSEISKKFWSDPGNRVAQCELMEAHWESPRASAHRAAIVASNKAIHTGKTRTDEAKAKMRAAKLGKPHARKRTPEWNARIAAAQQGVKRRPWTDEERARHAAATTPEVRAKMSAAAKARGARALDLELARYKARFGSLPGPDVD